MCVDVLLLLVSVFLLVVLCGNVVLGIVLALAGMRSPDGRMYVDGFNVHFSTADPVYCVSSVWTRGTR